MTIDEAIVRAELRQDYPAFPWKSDKEMKAFYALSAAALRLAKAMNEVCELEEHRD